MKIGLYGAGQMGSALALNLRDNGHQAAVFNRTAEKLQPLRAEGINVMETIEEFTAWLSEPKIIWLMVTSDAVDNVIRGLQPFLSPGDVLVDGSNSNYRDSIRREQEMKHRGIGFIDVGLSGGIQAARHGSCLMVGGEEAVVKTVERAFIDIAAEGGYARLGPPGSGHYAKMVHNGIEYAFMEAIGEGAALISSHPDIDLAALTGVWNSGSMISGPLMQLTRDILSEPEALADVLPRVDTSGEAGFSVLESVEQRIATPVLAASLYARYKSQDMSGLSEKLIASLRGRFGGHHVYTKGGNDK